MKTSGRDKSVIYNTAKALKPIPVLREGEGKEGRGRNSPTIEPSQEFSQSLKGAMKKCYVEEELRIAQYFPVGLKLNRHLKGRVLPVEGEKLRRKVKLIDKILREEFNVDEIERHEAKSEEESQRKLTYERRKEILEKKHIKQWKPVLFDKTAAFAYLITRSPAEYAVLETILNEIKRKER